MRLLLCLALVLSFAASSPAFGKIVQCETCNTLNAAAPWAADYGTGKHYVFSLSKNKLWHFQVRLQSGQYIAEPITIVAEMQTAFNEMRYFYLKNPTTFAKGVVIQVDITRIPGVHNPVRIAQHFNLFNGPGNGSNYNTWVTDFNNAMNNTQLRDQLHPDLGRLMRNETRLTGLSGGVSTDQGGMEGGAEWEYPADPTVEVRACNSNGDCVKMKSVAGGGDWQYTASTSMWGRGDDYPTRATCFNGCDLHFEPGFASAFRDGMVSAGTPMYNTISSHLRCGSANGFITTCVWITEYE